MAACCGRCRRCWRDGQNNVNDDAGLNATLIIVEHGEDARRTNVIGILANLGWNCLFVFDIACGAVMDG